MGWSGLASVRSKTFGIQSGKTRDPLHTNRKGLFLIQMPFGEQVLFALN